jgi:uncharacterized protein (TIGR00661 family)
MKVLYATQATGNGHLIRALELIPILKEHVDLDIFVSGSQGQIHLPFKIDYKKYGLSFVTGGKGGVSYVKTAKSLKLIKLFRDIKKCNVRDYDLIINDFEPITAWAAKIKGVKTIALSHQAAFLSRETPRPEKRNKTQEFILRHYAPTKDYMGFHFESYDKNIRTPIIPQDIRSLKVENHDEICVYLPSYRIDLLSHHFNKIPSFKWHIFSPFIKEQSEQDNVVINPVSRDGWIKAFQKASGCLIGAGFEGPSEALLHGKKLMVIPMKNQYEQICNAAALKELGVNVQFGIDSMFYQELNNWLIHDKAVQLDFPDHSHEVIQDALNCA